jgi:membrane protease YdiL (CAAX protease family)
VSAKGDDSSAAFSKAALHLERCTHDPRVGVKRVTGIAPRSLAFRLGATAYAAAIGRTSRPSLGLEEHAPMRTNNSSRDSREGEEAQEWALTLLLVFVAMVLTALVFEELLLRGLVVID